jgi:hypothetical protein
VTNRRLPRAGKRLLMESPMTGSILSGRSLIVFGLFLVSLFLCACAMAGQDGQQPQQWQQAYDGNSSIFTGPPVREPAPSDPLKFYQGIPIY